MVVPDACALGAAYFEEPYSDNAAPLLESIRLRNIDAVMPLIGVNEFLNICRRKLQNGEVRERDATSIVEDFLSLPVVWVEQDENVAIQAWNLHTCEGVGTNDAYYYLLAREWDGEIWTQDADMASVLASLGASVGDLRHRSFA